MVRCHLYCAEQIIVPETFPNILKTYAKDVIKTQPYDLLRWSAAYFRCLSLNIPPPVKRRLEKDASYGTLTKGILRVLLEQIGKGFYVRRDILQKRWEGLCLPESELLKFLSLCRMYNWTQVHWLKLFAVMVGTLNKSLKESVEMICELLTDDIEGSPSPIPIWMLKVCYTFIAEMDCSQEQEFENGRKVLENGDLEEEGPMPDSPQILSSVAFRDNIIREWKRRLDELSLHGTELGSLRELKTASSGDTFSNSDVSEKPSTISSTFRFVGNYEDPYDLVRKSPDFDSVIVLLNEINSIELHKYPGPGRVTSKSFEHARKRELEILEKRSKLFETYNEQAKKFIQEEKIELLKEIGPPWSWLHHFASQNCRDKSYNFLEYETYSIQSDVTPTESSDDSFDYEREEFYSPTDKHKKSIFIDEEKDKMLTIDSIMKEIMQNVMEAAEDGLIKLSDTSSIASFMKDSVSYENSEDHKRIIDFGPLKKYIEEAEEQGLKFKDMEELTDYFSSRCTENQIDPHVLKYSVFGEPVTENGIEESATPATPPPSEVISEMQKLANKNAPELSKVMSASLLKINSTEKMNVEASNGENIEQIFAESGIEVEQRLLSKKISDNMIIGLAEDPQCQDVEQDANEEVESLLEEQSAISETTPHQSGNDYSDVSSKRSRDSQLRTKKKKTKVDVEYIIPIEPFECTILPIQGIGATVSDRIIQDFLTYCKGRSKTQKGFIYPRNFKENECPYMMEPV